MDYVVSAAWLRFFIFLWCMYHVRVRCAQSPQGPAIVARLPFPAPQDFTGDVEFMRTRAYPLARGVGDFYASYATLNAGSYNVLHSCAQVRRRWHGRALVYFLAHPRVSLSLFLFVSRSLFSTPPLTTHDVRCRRAADRREARRASFHPTTTRPTTWPSSSASSARSWPGQRRWMSTPSSAPSGGRCWRMWPSTPRPQVKRARLCLRRPTSRMACLPSPTPSVPGAWRRLWPGPPPHVLRAVLHAKSPD